MGGTWRDNSYPGAACDVPSHLYSFSFEPKPDWSSRYARQAEIHEYIRHCVRKYHLGPRLRLNCEVSGARFDDATGFWHLTTATGEQITSRALVSACGQLNRPLYPSIPGLDDFAGEAFHSARWRDDVELADHSEEAGLGLEQGDDLAGADIQGDVAQHRDAADPLLAESRGQPTANVVATDRGTSCPTTKPTSILKPAAPS